MSSAGHHLGTACQRCRKRKIKCDLRTPQCGSCARARVVCMSSELDSSRAAGSLPPGYLESLEAEVAQLESDTSRLPQAPGLTFQEPEQPHHSSVIYNNNGSNSQSQGLIGASSVASGDHSSLFDWSTIGEVGSSILHPQLAYGMNRMIRSAINIDNRFPFHSRQPNPLLSHKRQTAGPYQAQSHIPVYLDAYLESVHSCFPILEETVFRSCRCLQFGDLIESPILLMVLAVGAVLCPDQGPLATYHAIELFTAAVDSYALALQTVTLQTLQFLLLVTFFSLLNPAGGSTWHLAGLALQVAISLGLHHSIIPGQTHPEKTQQNMFWSAYTLDRLVATSLGRPFGISDFDISTELPRHTPDMPCLHCLVNLAICFSRKETTQPSDWVPEPPVIQSIRGEFAQPQSSNNHIFYKSLALQLAVWAIGDLPQMEKWPTTSPEEHQRQLDVLNLCLQFTKAQSTAYRPLPWTAAYALFHAAILREVLIKRRHLMAPRDLHNSTEASVSVQSFESAMVSFEFFASSFRGLRDLTSIFKRLAGRGHADSSDLPGLEVLQNEDTRKVLRALVGLSSSGSSRSKDTFGIPSIYQDSASLG